MANPLVLAVDDEEAILRLIALELASEGFDVIPAGSGPEAIEITESREPDLVLIDVLMPGMDGFATLEALRTHRRIPAIFMSARNREQDRQRAFRMGAEDFLVKPFGVDELASRIRTILHLPANANSEHVVSVGPIEIDFGRRTLCCGEKVVDLSQTEWQIVEYLAHNINRVVSSNELLLNVWGPEYEGDVEYLGMWIARLQRKIDEVQPNAHMIQNHPGTGYSLAIREPGSNIA